MPLASVVVRLSHYLKKSARPQIEVSVKAIIEDTPLVLRLCHNSLNPSFRTRTPLADEIRNPETFNCTGLFWIPRPFRRGMTNCKTASLGGETRRFD